MTKQLFLEWFEFNVVSILILAVLTCGLATCQLPKCSAYPGPLSVLVMDNAKIHHGADVTELCDQFSESWFHVLSWLCADSHLGVHVEYLPLYSPDFQPIKEAFPKIKAFLHRNCTYYSQMNGWWNLVWHVQNYWNNYSRRCSWLLLCMQVTFEQSLVYVHFQTASYKIWATRNTEQRIKFLCKKQVQFGLQWRGTMQQEKVWLV